MKYNYDRSILKGLSVGPFLHLTDTRNEKIAQAPANIPPADLTPNLLARSLHPAVQYGVIDRVTEHSGAKTFHIVADEERGTKKLAYFRAGQYVTVALQIDGSTIHRPYTIQSDPADALAEQSSYTLTIKNNARGYAAPWILENWKEGTPVTLSGPLGNFYYVPIRDAQTVIGLAGGSGITPFCAMAAAIVSGLEDFDLTILYGSRTRDILLKEELDELSARSGGRVKVVHVLSDEEAEGYEHGFLTADLIRKYAPEGEYSIFMCGPKAMYSYEDKELSSLNLERRHVRKELSGEFGDPFKDPQYPGEKTEKTYRLTVVIRGQEQVIECKNTETLLTSMEKAGINAPSHCRSGECGWCHSLLVEGDVFTPKSQDGRRLADPKFGWIHPCVTYPLSDIKIDVAVPLK